MSGKFLSLEWFRSYGRWIRRNPGGAIVVFLGVVMFVLMVLLCIFCEHNLSSEASFQGQIGEVMLANDISLTVPEKGALLHWAN